MLARETVEKIIKTLRKKYLFGLSNLEWLTENLNQWVTLTPTPTPNPGITTK